MTTTWTILDRAHQALRTTVAGVTETEWGNATPCEHWTVTQVLQHAAGDQQGYAAMLTGSGFPTEDPFAPSGALTSTPLELLEPALAAASSAFAGIAADAVDVPVPLPQGPQPAWIAAGAAALDAAVHAWDIAVATGQASPLDAALAADLLIVAEQIVEPLRGFAYAAPVDVPVHDDVDRLLTYLGRRPTWAQTPAA